MPGMAPSVFCEIYLFIQTYFHVVLLTCVPAQFYHNVCMANFWGVSGSTFTSDNLSGNGQFMQFFFPLLTKEMLLCNKCNKINTQIHYLIIFKDHFIFESSVLPKQTPVYS